MKTKYFRTTTSYIVPSTVSRAASTVTTQQHLYSPLQVCERLTERKSFNAYRGRRTGGLNRSKENNRREANDLKIFQPFEIDIIQISDEFKCIYTLLSIFNNSNVKKGGAAARAPLGVSIYLFRSIHIILIRKKWNINE